MQSNELCKTVANKCQHLRRNRTLLKGVKMLYFSFDLNEIIHETEEEKKKYTESWILVLFYQFKLVFIINEPFNFGFYTNKICRCENVSISVLFDAMVKT